MKLGEKFSEFKMGMLFGADVLARGKATLRHPRCGRVEISRVKGEWVCTAVERPDTKAKGKARAAPKKAAPTTGRRKPCIACHDAGVDSSEHLCAVHSAAPELLEALETSATILHLACNARKGAENFEECSRSVCVANRAALKTAKGQP